MLSISKPIKGENGVAYYVEFANTNYYTEGGEPPGVWHGSAAEELCLSGDVDPKVLGHLFNGHSPDGWDTLVRNADSIHRQCGWDLTFSAPKSVSILWGICPSLRDKIEEAHNKAVRAGLDYIEAECGRLRKTGDKAKLVFALFQHGTSRALDPQLHTHCLLPNIAWALETGVISIREIFRHKMVAGSLYRAELAYRLRQSLPRLDLVKVRTWFEFKCVPENIMDFFSKRRRQMQAAMKEYGEENAKVAEMAALSTRPEKKSLPREVLFAEWISIGRQMGFFLPDYDPGIVVPKKKASHAIESLLQNRSYFSERELLRELCDTNQAGGKSAAELRAETKEALEKIVDLGMHEGERRYSTKEVLAREKAILNRVNGLRHDETHVVSRRRVDRFLEGKDLTAEQVSALRHITSTPGAVKVVDGLAGTGKSTMLKVAREIWESKGYQVIGGTVAGKAADGLQAATGIRSQTIAWLEIALNKPKGLDFARAWHGGPLIDDVSVGDSKVGKMMLGGASYREYAPPPPPSTISLDRVIRGGPLVVDTPLPDSYVGKIVFGDGSDAGKPPGSREKIVDVARAMRGGSLAANVSFEESVVGKLFRSDLSAPSGPPSKTVEIGPNTVLVLDEASMIGTKDMDWITKRIKECGAKLVVVGDSKQLPSIEAGGVFESLGNRIGKATLTEIRRQAEPWARQMVADFARGEVLKGLKELDKRGHVVVKGTKEDVRDALIAEWGEHGVRPANMILAHTNEEIGILNKLAQKERLRRQEIDHNGGFSHEKKDFYIGDRIMFLQNNRALGVSNGTIGTIKNVRREAPLRAHRLVSVRLDGGQEVCFSTRTYTKFDLAYAMTTTKAQGVTIDKAFSLVEDSHGSLENAYVQVSRAKTLLKLFMTRETAGDGLGDVARMMEKSNAQKLATDLHEKNQRSQTQQKSDTGRSR